MKIAKNPIKKLSVKNNAPIPIITETKKIKTKI